MRKQTCEGERKKKKGSSADGQRAQLYKVTWVMYFDC